MEDSTVMRTLGLIGGMSWESTAEYYRLINEETRRRLGGFHSAPILMHSFDFHEIEALQRSGDWNRAGDLLSAAARFLEDAGAELLVLCTNTMHKVAARIEESCRARFLHIAEVTADAVNAHGSVSTTVGLLGTRFTMEEEFYRARLEAHGLGVLIPDGAERGQIDRIIFEELVHGVIRDESRDIYRRVAGHLVESGAQAIVAGCTEIGMLLGPGDLSVPLFDTTRIHALAAVDAALAGG